MENDLLCLETSSIGAGFRALNSLPNVKLVDAEPIGGGRFLILVRGQAQALREFAKGQAEVADFEVIESVSQDVLDAVYSLAPAKLADSLLVAETETATAMLLLAQAVVVQHHLKAIEIKIRKSGLGGAYAYFTGNPSDCAAAAQTVRTRLTQHLRKGSVEMFEKPTSFVR
jgi:microcompartment protein CcmL/EutN